MYFQLYEACLVLSPPIITIQYFNSLSFHKNTYVHKYLCMLVQTQQHSNVYITCECPEQIVRFVYCVSAFVA